MQGLYESTQFQPYVQRICSLGERGLCGIFLMTVQLKFGEGKKKVDMPPSFDLVQSLLSGASRKDTSYVYVRESFWYERRPVCGLTKGLGVGASFFHHLHLTCLCMCVYGKSCCCQVTPPIMDFSMTFEFYTWVSRMWNVCTNSQYTHSNNLSATHKKLVMHKEFLIFFFCLLLFTQFKKKKKETRQD